MLKGERERRREKKLIVTCLFVVKGGAAGDAQGGEGEKEREKANCDVSVYCTRRSCGRCSREGSLSASVLSQFKARWGLG